MFKLADLKLNKKVVFVLVLSPICLSLIKYLGDFSFFLRFLENIGLSGLKTNLNELINQTGDTELRRLSFWIIILDVFYLIVPILLIKLILKESPISYGLSFKLEKGWWKIYLLFMCFMLPLVYIFSKTEAFQSKYPFYSISATTPLWPKFWVWELFYFSQFFCLEFFLEALW